MKRAEIAEQDRYQLARQREFRMAADVVCDAWAGFAEVEAVAVIGSVAKRLWKEVPRFREFRREGIEVLPELRAESTSRNRVRFRQFGRCAP